MEILGLASGIDSKSLIEQLMSIEKQPLTTLSNKKSTYQKQAAAWSDIKTRLVSLQDKLSALQVQDNFQSKKSISSDVKVAGVSSKPVALPGKYNLTVTSIATATRVESNSRLGSHIDSSVTLQEAGLGISVKAGTFSVNGVSFSVDPEIESLDDIINKINDPATGVPGVTAVYHGDTGKFALESIDPIQLGSGADTGNFFSAFWLDGQTGENITSIVPVGTVQRGAVLDSARFQNALSSTSEGKLEINGVTIEYDTTKDSLTLNARYTGSKTIQMRDLNGNFLQAAGLSEATQTMGENARFSIAEINGGISLTSSSNTIVGVIPGVNITLAGNGNTVLTVAEELKMQIKISKLWNTGWNKKESCC